jgi:hypothetical protein
LAHPIRMENSNVGAADPFGIINTDNQMPVKNGIRDFIDGGAFTEDEDRILCRRYDVGLG